jgi:hypothetical protein
MSKHYDPSDSSSSPFDPTMGAIVIYKAPRQSLNDVPQSFPAMITNTYPDDRCDLVVFSNIGTRYIRSVPFSSDPESLHSWNWAEKPTERPKKKLSSKVGVGSE